MSPKTVYIATGPNSGTPRTDMRARTMRVGRLELCSSWLVGPVPSWFYCEPAGLLHTGAVCFTLRVWRAMVGYRWYAAKEARK
jgi:hypothetical protein